jgi:hypothetical protein
MVKTLLNLIVFHPAYLSLTVLHQVLAALEHITPFTTSVMKKHTSCTNRLFIHIIYIYYQRKYLKNNIACLVSV